MTSQLASYAYQRQSSVGAGKENQTVLSRY